MTWFLSAVLMRDGTLHCAPEYTDSHETLLSAVGIRDGWAQADRFFRVAYCPPSNPTRLGKWMWVEGELAPGWLTREVREAAERKLLAHVRRMLVTEPRRTVLGGCYIICEGGSIRELIRGRVVWAVGANLVNACWVGANLQHANLAGADLSHSRLAWSDLSGADLTGATLTACDVTGVRWDGPPEGWEVDGDGRLGRVR